MPNHQEERSTLLIVWLGQLGVNLVNFGQCVYICSYELFPHFIQGRFELYSQYLYIAKTTSSLSFSNFQLMTWLNGETVKRESSSMIYDEGLIYQRHVTKP